MISIADLITPATADDVLEGFLSKIESYNVPARSWRKAGALRTILRVVATTYAGFTELMVAAIKSGFLDDATGGWLTLLAHYVYGVDRIDATFATTKVTLANTSGGVYTKAARAYQVKNPDSGKVYTNVAGFTLGAGATLAGLDFIAIEIGAASSCAPGTITDQVTFLNGVTVTNTIAAIGTDQEQDEPLRQRCREKLESLSPLGPRGAYAYAVRSATLDDGSPAGINRIATSPSSSTGTVDIWCATAAGTPSTAALDAVSASIERIARPDSVTVNLHGVTAVALTQTITVWAEVTPGLDAPTLVQLVDDALIAMIQNYPIGGIPKPPSSTGYLFASKINGAVEDAHPAIFAVDGAVDLAIPAGSVATLASTIDVRLVPSRVAL